MNATAQNLEPKEQRQVSVNGYIDAITGNRIYGWAWDAQQPKAKITIRLQQVDNTVGIVAADLPREDLKASGIGDGAHAFEAAIPDDISPNDISILAVCPDTGATVELAPRAIAGRSSASGSDQDLRTAVETLTKSHGFIHRKLQAIAKVVAEKRRDDEVATDAAGTPVNAADMAPLSRLQTLEDAVLRLDDLVQSQGASIDAMQHRPTDRLPRFLAIAAVVLSFAALVIALIQ
jgi:hypothetical protein